MKKVLIMIEDIRESSSITDVLLEIAIPLKKQQQKVALFIDNAQGGEVAERLRVKGVPVYDLMHSCYPTMEKAYDVLLAFDDWAIQKSTLFKGIEKIKVGATSDPDTIISRVMQVEGDFEDDEDEDEGEEIIPDEDKLAAVAEMIQCPACGSDNTPGAAECAICGEKFADAPKVETPSKPAKKVAKKKKAGKKKKVAKK